LICDIDADAIGGLTLGADPIALATSLEAYRQGRELLPLVVRKEPKGHGTARYIEGHAAKVKRVIAVDDVITTGGSTIKAIERMREAGMDVVAAAVIIDRQESDGRKNIEDLGVPVRAMYLRSEFDTMRLEREKQNR
jgi:orotate phosphoribosyltransferase